MHVLPLKEQKNHGEDRLILPKHAAPSQTNFNLATGRQPCPTKRTMHQAHPLQRVLRHPQSLMSTLQTDKRNARKADLVLKARSCSTLAEKKDSFDVFLHATLLRPATFCPAFFTPIFLVTSYTFSCTSTPLSLTDAVPDTKPPSPPPSTPVPMCRSGSLTCPKRVFAFPALLAKSHHFLSLTHCRFFVHLPC